MSENVMEQALVPLRRSNNHLRAVDDVRDQVDADGVGKWDARVLRDHLSFCNGQLTFSSPEKGCAALTPTNWATGQLCARLGIPAPYFRKCPAELQDVQANHWLSNSKEVDGEKWLVRAKDEQLRAVLSSRYSPLDNDELLRALSPMMDACLRVDWVDLSDEGLHLRIVDPQKTQDVLPGDGLSVGIHIANSEVGGRSLSVDALVYRLVCTNGLIRLVKGKSLLRQRHIHIARPRLVAALEEAVEQAWNEASGFLEQMRQTTQMPVPDVEGTIERIGERWHLSQSVQEGILGDLRREPVRVQETVYGVVNALTSAAQRLPAEGRYDLEVLAGHLAEHGVAAYAPKRRHEPQENGRNGDQPFDVVETAREMLDAQIVSRRPILHREVNGR